MMTSANINGAEGYISEELKLAARAWQLGNIVEARKHFSELANQGDPRGLYWLGRCYVDTRLPDHSVEKGLNYFKEAAQNRYSPAFLEVARFYHAGIGMKPSLPDALEYYTLAMEGGTVDDIGLMALLASDKAAKAIQFLDTAPEGPYPEAYFETAWRFLEGKGIEQSEQKAFKFFVLAANQGHIASQLSKAKAYMYGLLGQPQEVDQALAIIRKLVAVGDATAICNLGICFWRGLGVSPSHEQAIQAWIKAAQLDKQYTGYSVYTRMLNGQYKSDYLLAIYDNFKYASTIDPWACFLFKEFENLKIWETLNKNGIMAKFTDPVRKELSERFEEYLQGEHSSLLLAKHHIRKA